MPQNLTNVVVSIYFDNSVIMWENNGFEPANLRQCLAAPGPVILPANARSRNSVILFPFRSLQFMKSPLFRSNPVGALCKGLLVLVLFLCASIPQAKAQPDYAPALWNQAYAGHWYTSGNGHYFCVIHDMEGYYESTISYFQQASQGTGKASIHYCVNGLKNGNDGTHFENNTGDAAAGEITQMAREAYYAWHVSCWNTWMFGTEHEGFASSPAWYTEAMYQASAGLQRHLCDAYGIPKDRNHIIGHNEWQNSAWKTWMAANFPSIDTTCNNHTDPGQYWNWNHFMALVTGAPAAPTALNASPLSTNHIKLTWVDNSTNESGFKIDRSASASGPWTQIASLGANIIAYTNSGLAASTVYYYRVYAYNTTNGNSGYSNIRSATTGNSAPVLGAIGNKTVTEGTLLTFTATTVDAGLGATASVTDFESFGAGSANVMFQYPAYSGSSRGMDTNANSTAVTASYPAGHASVNVLKASWNFAVGATNPWLRLTTFNSSGLPNPVIDLKQIIKFDIYTDKALKVGLGVRETTNAAGTAVGSNGGSGGGIEWVGVTNVTATGAPVPKRTVAAGSWQTLQFNLPYEATSNFVNGNSVLSTASGLGVLEHLALVPTGGSGAYNIYLDNFSVVYSNTLTFTLDAGAPPGATIDPRTGVFNWIPTEAQGPGIYPITVRVTDNGTPALSDFETISVVVDETNTAPVLASSANKSVVEETLLTFTATATDSDVPVNGLTFSLDPGAPAGAAINPDSGLFSWMPTEAQGPGSYPITVRVTDDGSPPLSHSRNFTITVTESNRAPVLAMVADQTISPGSTLTLTNSATDPDLPANTLTFSLDGGGPIGASVDSVSGVFSWTPDASQIGTTNGVTVRVTDNGSPNLSDVRSFNIVVIAAPITASASVAGQTITLQWNSVPGKTYRVVYLDEASGTNWNTLPPDVNATGSTSTATDSMGTSSRFYRVQLVN
ncbi:MAG: N-acetylmuramoyl-L-alanine amidase [Pedosphaera sp.]|nr:N-acetylmuramoyl-L-alanine amidase [Pedosphaera sp.]